MASIRQIVEGLEILAESALPMKGSGDTGKDVQIGGAEHDVIFGPEIGHLKEGQVKRLLQLGWHFDDECQCWARFC